jgi:hypothetical protein
MVLAPTWKVAQTAVITNGPSAEVLDMTPCMHRCQIFELVACLGRRRLIGHYKIQATVLYGAWSRREPEVSQARE